MHAICGIKSSAGWYGKKLMLGAGIAPQRMANAKMTSLCEKRHGCK
jgi:hypothetical protein